MDATDLNLDSLNLRKPWLIFMEILKEKLGEDKKKNIGEDEGKTNMDRKKEKRNKN